MTDFLLKTVNPDGAAWGGFRWTLDEGAEVIAPDWDPTPVCGGGLHGLLNGAGNGGLIDWSTDAVWIVAEIPDGETVVDIDGKVKVRRCIVRHVGDKTSAPEFLAAHGHTEGVVGGTATAGDGGTATAGYGGTATAGVDGAATAGYRGTATAGDDGTATAGYDGTATAGVRGTATAGDGGTATAGVGGTATAGDGGTATAGVDGTIILAWWDYDLGRRRWVVGEVGIDGIVADTPYRVVDGAFVEVES